ncbi:MAG: hypothetical protein BLM47_06535 [Candidatus Reconcilbacillus cellulovorans]|uniref:Uncharacterized protein n=1 Tax=Candidatus Reconcilbacillus cellulovorans TaxID=1906605 RepID=A0A2A6DZP4_9BACL|nr:MAG: hypothetical protein BLM47_06535 [Candidatus Reconcilbacillus cellulovorans]
MPSADLLDLFVQFTRECRFESVIFAEGVDKLYVQVYNFVEEMSQAGETVFRAEGTACSTS